MAREKWLIWMRVKNQLGAKLQLHESTSYKVSLRIYSAKFSDSLGVFDMRYMVTIRESVRTVF